MLGRTQRNQGDFVDQRDRFPASTSCQVLCSRTAYDRIIHFTQRPVAPGSISLTSKYEANQQSTAMGLNHSFTSHGRFVLSFIWITDQTKSLICAIAELTRHTIDVPAYDALYSRRMRNAAAEQTVTHSPHERQVVSSRSICLSGNRRRAP